MELGECNMSLGVDKSKCEMLLLTVEVGEI